MIKHVIILLCLCIAICRADNQTSPNYETEQKREDEEIIGGIGGTGLRDMERPELIERPDIDIDDIRGATTEASDSISPPDIDLEDMTPP